VSQRVFAPGFRLSSLDLVVMLLGAVAAAGLLFVATWAAVVVAFVIGHFFLFCNVFRISRGLELAWGANFTGLAAVTVLTGIPGWLITIALSFGATIVVVMVQMRKPSYHGVYWQRVNPRLREWWESSSGKELGESTTGEQR